MSYSYDNNKQWIFTEDGSALFIKCRDSILVLLKSTGCATVGNATCVMKGVGDSWKELAVIDRMIELGDIQYVPGTEDRAGQHRLIEFLPDKW